MFRCLTSTVGGLLLIFVATAVIEVDGIPAKIRRLKSTTTPEPLEYEEEHVNEDEEMARHMTPQCVDTMQKLSDDIEALNGNPNPEKSRALLQKLMKGGCGSLVQYLMKKKSA